MSAFRQAARHPAFVPGLLLAGVLAFFFAFLFAVWQARIDGVSLRRNVQEERLLRMTARLDERLLRIESDGRNLLEKNDLVKLLSLAPDPALSPERAEKPKKPVPPKGRVRKIVPRAEIPIARPPLPPGAKALAILDPLGKAVPALPDGLRLPRNPGGRGFTLDVVSGALWLALPLTGGNGFQGTVLIAYEWKNLLQGEDPAGVLGDLCQPPLTTPGGTAVFDLSTRPSEIGLLKDVDERMQSSRSEKGWFHLAVRGKSALYATLSPFPIRVAVLYPDNRLGIPGVSLGVLLALLLAAAGAFVFTYLALSRARSHATEEHLPTRVLEARSHVPGDATIGRTENHGSDEPLVDLDAHLAELRNPRTAMAEEGRFPTSPSERRETSFFDAAPLASLPKEALQDETRPSEPAFQGRKASEMSRNAAPAPLSEIQPEERADETRDEREGSTSVGPEDETIEVDLDEGELPSPNEARSEDDAASDRLSEMDIPAADDELADEEAPAESAELRIPDEIFRRPKEAKGEISSLLDDLGPKASDTLRGSAPVPAPARTKEGTRSLADVAAFLAKRPDLFDAESDVIARIAEETGEARFYDLALWFRKPDGAWVSFEKRGFADSTAGRFPFSENDEIWKRWLGKGKPVHIGRDVKSSRLLTGWLLPEERARHRQIALVPVKKQDSVRWLLLLGSPEAEAKVG